MRGPPNGPAFLRQLVALADELYAYQVTPEMLLAQVADMEGAAGDKLRSAALIYGAYDAHLRGEGFDAAPACRSCAMPCRSRTI